MTIFRFIDISPHSKQIFSNFSRLEVRYIQFVAKMLQFKLKNRKKNTIEIFFKTIDISNNSNKKYRLLHDLIKIPYEPQKSEPHEESEERNSAVPSTLATTKIFLLPCSKPVDASRAKEKEREKQKQRKREREKRSFPFPVPSPDGATEISTQVLTYTSSYGRPECIWAVVMGI